jgi:5-hydroxyisourate hydrolase-like protein (transthyretin family)
MTIEFDRRTLLQAGAAVAATATSVGAQHAPAKLSTHALDMYLGKQAAGMRIDFSRKEGDGWKLLKTVIADEEGRVGEELMSAETMAVGRYELLFHVEDYYKRSGVKLTDTRPSSTRCRCALPSSTSRNPITCRSTSRRGAS